MNSFDRARANQTRNAQLALIQQMQSAPSLSSLAARQAIQSGASQGLSAMGGGPLASAQALQRVSGAGAEALQSLAQQASQEDFGTRAAAGGALQGLRGRDIQSAQADAEAKLKELALNDQIRARAAALGTGVQNSRQQALLEFFRQKQEQERREANRTQQDIQQGAQTAAPLLAMLAGA